MANEIERLASAGAIDLVAEVDVGDIGPTGSGDINRVGRLLQPACLLHLAHPVNSWTYPGEGVTSGVAGDDAALAAVQIAVAVGVQENRPTREARFGPAGHT